MPCDTLRVDGEKVYYYLPSGKCWELLYDFSISVGETVSVVIPGNWNNESGNLQTLRCMGSKEDEGIKMLYMLEQEIAESGDIYNPVYGTWIAGLGSTKGVISMLFFNSSGGTTTLIEAKLGDSIIYSKPSGIESAIAGSVESPEIWYNLDGTKMEGAPTAKGLYIVRRGAKAEKRITN